MSKINKEVASAAMIYAMLEGSSISDASDIQVDIDVDELVENDTEDCEGDKNKSKKKAVRKPKKTEEEIRAEKALADRLDEYEYAELKKSERFVVVLNQHEIPYKEQRWNIDKRQVVYEVSRIDSKTSAGRVVRSMYTDDKLKEKLEKAYSGENRYYEIRVLSEVVPTRVTRLGYIEITPNKRDNRIKLHRSDMESAHITYEDVLKDVKKVVKELVKYR